MPEWSRVGTAAVTVYGLGLDREMFAHVRLDES